MISSSPILEAGQVALYRCVVRPQSGGDPRSASTLADAHALGLTTIANIECQDLFFLEGRLTTKDLERLASALLSDPLTQSVEWGRIFLSGETHQPLPGVIDVALRPGVTDPVAEQVLRAAQVLGIHGLERVATGQRYLIQGEGLQEGHLQESDLRRLAQRLLANPVIQHYTLGEIAPVFPQTAQASTRVEILPVRELDEPGLLALSRERRAALDLAEMRAIQAYYRRQGRDPSDVELEMIAQTWSEHCVHKTFRALIEVETEGRPGTQTVNGLLKQYIRQATEEIDAPWVRSAFVDNAGILDFDDEYEVSFKVETHNHPSAIEPFGGANTGTGGVIRDVLGVSARPIAATDVLCFGPAEMDPATLPEGVLHPRRIRAGVVSGVQDYGNKIGIPTVSGAILYDPGFTANPLVFCGCVGLAPKGSHPSQVQPGDRVIVLGGRTGRDGLRGATFSSMTMDGQTGEVAGASVQIGDPITEKGLIEVVVRARDLGLYTAITDCGAGGLSSAVGEMARQGGAEVDLRQVELKYPGLAPWEIWLSEAQERMVLAVPPQALPELQSLCTTYDVHLTDIGSFNTSQYIRVRYGEQVVLDLENDFLHEGIPQRHLKARIPAIQTAPMGELPEFDPAQVLLKLLAHPNIASKEAVIRLYDHEIQGGTVVKPLTGVYNDGPSDACVLKPFGTQGMTGLVLSAGINPEYGKLDAYRMAWSVVDEAIRNAVAVGADPERLALLDNFCWGDPLRPETLGSLVAAARGCYDAAVHYHTPFISGKDSLNNEYLSVDERGQPVRTAIPPTLLISGMAIIADIGKAVTLDLKAAGNVLYLVGDFRPTLGGSHLAQVVALAGGPDKVPDAPRHAPSVYGALHRAMQHGLVRACHDLSEGGLAVAAAEMCIAGRMGLELYVEDANPRLALFGETNGCLLVEVPVEQAPAFEGLFAGLPVRRLGMVNATPRLVMHGPERELLVLDVEQLRQAWQAEEAK